MAQVLPKILTKEQFMIFMMKGLTKREPERQKYACLLTFIYDAGLRVSEAINLKKSDIDLQNNTLFVNQGKGKKDRLLPMTKAMVLRYEKHMEARHFDTEYLFTADLPANRNKLNRATVNDTMKKMSKKSGIYRNDGKPVNPHALRHSFATNKFNEGYSMLEIKKMMGHVSFQSTEIYIALAVDNLVKKAQAEKVPDWQEKL